MTTKKSGTAPVEDQEYDFSGDAGAGLENVTQADLGIPFIDIIQSGSKQRKKDNALYIKGAEEGDIFISAPGQIVGNPINPLHFTVAYFRSAWVEWKGNRGGFVKSHDTAGVLTQTTKGGQNGNENVLPNGNVIVETKYFCGFAEVDGRPRPGIIALKSTQLKKAKHWLSLLKAQRGKTADGTEYEMPAFASRFALTTALEKHEKGEAYGWVIAPAGRNKDMALIGAAKSMIAENKLMLVAHNEPNDGVDASSVM